LKDVEQHREELVTLLWRVLEQMGPRLPDEDREIIADFVDNYEFGVAVEWLEAVARRLQLPVPEAAARDLAAAKKKMGLSA
jgi:hypothetical protein